MRRAMPVDEYADAYVPGPPLTVDVLREKLKALPGAKASITTEEGRKLIHLCARQGYWVRVTARTKSDDTVVRWGVPVLTAHPPLGYSGSSPDGSRLNYPHLHRYDPKPHWRKEGEYLIIRQGNGTPPWRRFKSYTDFEGPYVDEINQGEPGAEPDSEPGAEPDGGPAPAAAAAPAVPAAAAGPAVPAAPAAAPRRSTRVRKPVTIYDPSEPPEPAPAPAVDPLASLRPRRARRPPNRFGF